MRLVMEFIFTDKCYLKEKMEILCELTNNDTPNIGMLTSASKLGSIKISDQGLHILSN